jgi:hypothetical protein
VFSCTAQGRWLRHRARLGYCVTFLEDGQ